MAFNLRRKLIHFYVKIVRAEGTPTYIARGWALGMFIGCVIPMSAQLLISIPLSFVLRCSKIGATLGTFITNPVTVLFIYPAQCWVGNKIIGGSLSWEATQQAARDLVKLDVSGFLHLGDTLILSLFTHAFAPAVLKVLIDLLCSLGFTSTICNTFLRRVGRIMPFSSKGETISTSPSSDLLPDTDVSEVGLRLISIRGLLGLRRSSS